MGVERRDEPQLLPPVAHEVLAPPHPDLFERFLGSIKSKTAPDNVEHTIVFEVFKESSYYSFSVAMQEFIFWGG